MFTTPATTQNPYIILLEFVYVAEQMGIKSKGNISNIKATPMKLGTHTFAGSATGGITGYSGQMLVFGADESSNVRLLVSQDALAFTRDGSTWYKVNATLVQ